MTLQYKPNTAKQYLKRHDPVMADLIKRVGHFNIETEFELSPFEALLRAIVYQQLSGKAAGTIHGRVLKLFKGGVTPRKILNRDHDTLRGAGLSNNKVLAVQDLAAKTLDGTVPTIEVLQSLSDDDIVERLTSVRGIGRWTVEMMLIFKLGRANVLPVADLGVRKGYQLAYNTEELPTVSELTDAGETWAPYRSVASWYLWRATDEIDWIKNPSIVIHESG